MGTDVQKILRGLVHFQHSDRGAVGVKSFPLASQLEVELEANSAVKCVKLTSRLRFFLCICPDF